MHGAIKNSYQILEGIPEGKRPIRRPKCRWRIG
jgi:hypothetical protein